MRQDHMLPVSPKSDKIHPFLYIACSAESDPSVWTYIQAMRPYLAVNHIDYIVGTVRLPSDVRRPALYYCPSLDLKTDPAGPYSVLRVSSMHPSSCGFRCAERIKRYREPLSAQPVYISRTRREEAQDLPAVWDQLAGKTDREPAAVLTPYRSELARQTVRGLCDYWGLSFQDV